MKNIHLTVLMLLTLLFSACKDDTFRGIGDVPVGEPALIDLRINVAAQKAVSRSLDQDFESRINQMVIIGFENTTGDKITLSLTGNLADKGTTNLAGRTYELNSPIETKSGNYDLYLIANWQSVYSNLTQSAIEAMSREEIEAMTFTNTGHQTELFGDYGFPMTQKISNFTIYPKEEQVTTLTGVSMKRASAHITFRFKNGAGVGDNKPNFVPNSYTVYRLPEEATSFADAQPIQSGTFDSEHIAITGAGNSSEDGYAYAFDFYMLENDQTNNVTAEQKAAIKNAENQQAAREAWVGTGNDYSNRKFTNAPAGSTFVVVQGDYSGPAAYDTNDQYTSTPYFGSVQYIIHLGNMDANAGGSYDNFNVLRNEFHTYSVTVNGAHSILVNVTVADGYGNPGMEGYLNLQPLAELDAHYAKVMLQIPKTSVHRTNDPKNKNHIILSTPKNGFNEQDIVCADLTDADDYKWIQFQNPGADWETTFPEYAGINTTTGECLKTGGREWAHVKELIEELANYMEAQYNNTTRPTLKYAYTTDNSDNFYVAAFVDENVYCDDQSLAIIDWAGYSHENRVMTLNPIDRKVSDDLQSIYAEGSAFNIHQCPVVSTYSLNPNNAPDPSTYNPFGFEQVEEKTTVTTNVTTGDQVKAYSNGYFGSALEWDLEASATPSIINDANGRQMMLEMFNIFSTGDGMADVRDSFYKLTSKTAGYSTYEFVPSNFYQVSQAINMRNRDLDGNGYLSPDEIRWYIPSLIQYYIYNFGYTVIPDNLLLGQKGEDNVSVAGLNADWVIPRYFTSSRAMRRVFYQDMRGGTDALTNSWVSQLNNIRFARNLGKMTDSYKEDYTRMTQIDTDKHIIKVINKGICRNFSWTTAYPAGFDAFSEYNLLPTAFEYNINGLTLYNQNGDYKLYYDNHTKEEQIAFLNQSALNTYNQNNGTSLTALPDGWRLPNQRELIVMVINNIIPSCFSGVTQENIDTPANTALGYLIGVTYCSSKLWANRVTPMWFASTAMTIPSNWFQYGPMRAILVRDVDPNTGEPIATQSSTASAKLRAKGVVRKK